MEIKRNLGYITSVFNNTAFDQKFFTELPHKAVNSLWGLIIGDALGVPVQFKKRDSYPLLTDMENCYYGDECIPAGTFSDDTALTLATLDAYEQKELSIQETAMKNFADWYLYGKYTQDGEAWDIGRTTQNAIINYLKHKIPAVKCGDSSVLSNGNGSLMRFLPVACIIYNNLYQYAESCTNLSNTLAFDNFLEEYFKNLNFSHQMSSLTHAHIISGIACDIYVTLMYHIFEGFSKEQLISNTLKLLNAYAENDNVYKYNLKFFKRVFSNDFPNLSLNEIKSSGYVIDTLEAALWCFLTTDNPKDCLIKAVNLGEDTDTIGAIAGSIACAYYNELPDINWYKSIRPCYEQSSLKKYESIIYNIMNIK